MKEIIRGEKWVLDLYPQDDNNSNYKLSEYTIIEKYDDGYLLLHTLSWSLFFLTEEEYKNILYYDYFKKYKILLNENIDETQLAKDIFLKRSTIKTLPNYEKVKTFIIYTTNKCNAQCFYCYEKNRLKQIYMSSKTADDIADFIIKKGYGKIHIQWFGGEPLLNTSVINQICEKLTLNNIEFSSSMITNGLLLNEKIIHNMNTSWKFEYIQVSIDGINETYNEIKNYKNKNIDAFKIVSNNIKNVLNLSDIKLYIRINVSKDNIENVKETIKYFHDNFMEYLKNERLVLYTSLLYEIYTTDLDTFNNLTSEIFSLTQTYPYLQKPSWYKILSHTTLLMCMGDKGVTLSINPEGYFTICNHWNDDNIIGDIYNGITNYDVLKKWYEKDKENINFCLENKCKYLPICVHHYKCEASPICSTINEINIKIGHLRKSMIYTYNEYKKRINQMKNGEE